MVNAAVAVDLKFSRRYCLTYNLRAQYKSTEEIQCEKSYVNRTILVYELKM